MALSVLRVLSQSILLRNHLLLTRMILGESRVSKGHVCDASVGNHTWLDCAVIIRWRGCLLVVTRTWLSELQCTPFRLVKGRASLNFQAFLEGATTS
jgi:hypothetical protein